MPTLMTIGAQQSFGAPGCAFGARTAVAAGINTSVVIPQGCWLIECDANTTVRFTYNSGGAFVTWLAAAGVGMIYSDGFSVEIRGGASAGTAQRSQIFPMSA